MMCKFEHDGDCCNCGSPQYMCKCKPKLCGSLVPMTNADRIRAMSDEELARELALIAEWDRKQLQKAKSGPGLVEFMEHWLQQPAEEDT